LEDALEIVLDGMREGMRDSERDVVPKRRERNPPRDRFMRFAWAGSSGVNRSGLLAGSRRYQRMVSSVSARFCLGLGLDASVVSCVSVSGLGMSRCRSCSVRKSVSLWGPSCCMRL